MSEAHTLIRQAYSVMTREATRPPKNKIEKFNTKKKAQTNMKNRPRYLYSGKLRNKCTFHVITARQRAAYTL